MPTNGITLTLVKEPTALKSPAIPGIKREERSFAPPDLTSLTDISAYTASLVQNLKSKDHGTSTAAKHALKGLPVSLVVKDLDFAKAAVAAKTVYRLKLMTPDDLLNAMASGIAKNIKQIKECETSLGKGEPGRLTIGGLLKPGLKIESFTSPGFTHASIKEALTSETSRGNPNLAVIFPKYAPKKESSITHPADELSKAIAAARYHPHIGCCGNELVADH